MLHTDLAPTVQDLGWSCRRSAEVASASFCPWFYGDVIRGGEWEAWSAAQSCVISGPVQFSVVS